MTTVNWYSMKELYTLYGVKSEEEFLKIYGISSIFSKLESEDIKLSNGKSYYSERVKKQVLVVREQHKTWYQKQWMTIDELASVTGFSNGAALLAQPELEKIINSFSNTDEVKSGGYHYTTKFYSQKVFKAIREYQVKVSMGKILGDKNTVTIKDTNYLMTEAMKESWDYIKEELSNIYLNSEAINKKITELENKINTFFSVSQKHSEEKDKSNSIIKFLKVKKTLYMKTSLPRTEGWELTDKIQIVYKNKELYLSKTKDGSSLTPSSKKFLINYKAVPQELMEQFNIEPTEQGFYFIQGLKTSDGGLLFPLSEVKIENKKNKINRGEKNDRH